MQLERLQWDPKSPVEPGVGISSNSFSDDFRFKLLIEPQNSHRIAQAGRDLERLSDLNFCGKGRLEKIIQHPLQLHCENLQ